MRDISEIIVHCSATPKGRNVDTAEIRRWHTEDNGWSDIGYHFVVELDGDIGVGRPQEKVRRTLQGQELYIHWCVLCRRYCREWNCRRYTHR